MPDSTMVPAQLSFTIRNSDLNNGSDSQIKTASRWPFDRAQRTAGKIGEPESFGSQ